MTDGFTAPQFDAVRAAFARNLSQGPEHGGAVAVWLDGQPVVDLWGGTRDLARSQPWQRDTLVNVWSVGKGVVALAVAMLVERGQLDYRAPVARYWPELGELVRRVDGRSIGRFVADEIAGPLGMAFWFGLPLEQDHRVAELSADDKAYDWVRQCEASAYPAAFLHRRLSATAPNERAWRAAEMPAGNGQGDARSLAHLYGVLACGGSANGRALIRPETIALAVAERFNGTDACSGSETVFGAGFRIGAIGYGPHVSVGNFGHTGWGGSVAFADPARRLGFAYVTNRLLGFDDGIDPRRQRLLDAVYAAL